MPVKPEVNPKPRSWRYWIQFVLVGLGLVLVLLFMYALSDVFVPLLIALALAYILNPVVVWLEGRGMTRKRAIIWLFVVMILGLVIGVVSFVPVLAREVGTWAVAIIGEDATTVVDDPERAVQEGTRSMDLLLPGEFIDRKNAAGEFDGLYDPDREFARLTYRDDELRPGRAVILPGYFLDENGNKKWDPGEKANRDVPDVKLKPGESDRKTGELPPATFLDANGNGRYDDGERKNAEYGDSQLMPGRKLPRPGHYIDSNRNGRYDPGYLDRIHRHVSDPNTWLGGIVRQLGRWSRDTETQKLVRVQVYDTLRTRAGDILKATTRITRGGLTAIGEGLTGAMALAISAILIPFYVFFFLLGLSDIRDTIYAYIPQDYRDQTIRILDRIHEANAAFFRGRLIVCGIIGLFMAIGFVICGLRFGVLFGILIGATSFVPFLSIVPMVPITIIALMDLSGWGFAGVWIFYFLGAQGLDALITPKILGKKMGQHPITIVVSLFIFAKLLGFLGMLLAIPITAALKIVAQELVLPVLAKVAEPDAHPDMSEPSEHPPPGVAEPPPVEPQGAPAAASPAPAKKVSSRASKSKKARSQTSTEKTKRTKRTRRKKQ